MKIKRLGLARLKSILQIQVVVKCLLIGNQQQDKMINLKLLTFQGLEPDVIKNCRKLPLSRFDGKEAIIATEKLSE